MSSTHHKEKVRVSNRLRLHVVDLVPNGDTRPFVIGTNRAVESVASPPANWANAKYLTVRCPRPTAFQTLGAGGRRGLMSRVAASIGFAWIAGNCRRALTRPHERTADTPPGRHALTSPILSRSAGSGIRATQAAGLKLPSYHHLSPAHSAAARVPARAFVRSISARKSGVKWKFQTTPEPASVGFWVRPMNPFSSSCAVRR